MKDIIKCDDVDISEINYMNPEKINQSYFASMNYSNKSQPLYIQTPKLKCKTNISDLKDKKIPYLEVEVPRDKMYIYDFLLSLDDNNIKKTVENSQEWFGKEIPLEAIDDMYKRTTRPFKKNTLPSIRLRLPTIKNDIKCGVYNQHRVFVGLDQVTDNSDVVIILHIRGLKILKTTYYCDCYISQIKVFQELEAKYNIIPEYSIVEDDTEEDTDNIFSEEIYYSEQEKMKEEKMKEEKMKIQEKAKMEKLQEIKNMEDAIELKRKEIEEL